MHRLSLPFRLALLGLGAFALTIDANCSFCAYNPSGQAVTFDLSAMRGTAYEAQSGRFTYTVSTPCGNSNSKHCGIQVCCFARFLTRA